MVKFMHVDKSMHNFCCQAYLKEGWADLLLVHIAKRVTEDGVNGNKL